MLLMAAVGALVALSGCLSARSRFLQERQPQNEHFDPAAVLPLMGGPFVEVARAEGQNVGIMKLPMNSQLLPRYHRKTDVILVGVAGRAIIRVEDTRYVLKPGQVVVLPRMTIYAIMPHKTEQDFSALVVCSPPYDARDVELTD